MILIQKPKQKKVKLLRVILGSPPFQVDMSRHEMTATMMKMTIIATIEIPTRTFIEQQCLLTTRSSTGVTKCYHEL